jgi:hydrogenase expression/formation protein HypC
MCLAVPGKLVSMSGGEAVSRSGKVDFGGLVKEVSLAFVPDAGEGDYLLVHAGIAIGIIDQDEAKRVAGYVEEICREDSGDERG